MPIPFASLVPLLAPVVSAGLNFVGESIAARRQRKFAQDAWNQQNEYNSPARQLTRFKAAGMSPAYGGGISSGQAAPLSQAATTVAKPSFPNMLEVLAQYQSLKNAAIEGDRLKAIRDGIVTDNAIKVLNRSFLSKTLDSRIDQAQTIGARSRYQMYLDENRVRFNNELRDSNLNPELMSYKNSAMNYQLSKQKLDQDAEMFKLNKAIQELTLKNTQAGINQGDNVVLRMLYRAFSGDSPILNRFKK